MLAYRMVPEQRLVGIAFAWVDAEQHQAGRLAVNAVNWNECVDAQPIFKPYQQRFLQVLARRRDG